MATTTGAKVFICAHCASVCGHGEFYSIFDHGGSAPIIEGCFACVEKFMVNLPKHVACGVDSLCPVCSLSVDINEFYALRANGYASALANCCYGCMTRFLSNITLSRHLGAAHQTTRCQHCAQLLPDYAIRIINISRLANATLYSYKTAAYEGCWLCFVKLMSSTLSTMQRGGPHCEDCGIALSRGGVGANKYWSCDGEWLAVLCDGCFAQRANPTPSNAAAKQNTAAAVSQAMKQANQAVAQATSNQLFLRGKQGVSPFGSISFRFDDDDGKTSISKAESEAKGLLRRAARYVQVCLEGGDWDIIDPDAGVSAGLLNELRRYLNLPENFDFTKREPSK